MSHQPKYLHFKFEEMNIRNRNSILEIIRDRELGYYGQRSGYSNYGFKSLISSIKCKALPRISSLLEFPECIDWYYNIKQSNWGTPIISCFDRCDKYSHVLYKTKFLYNSQCANKDNDNYPPNLVKGLDLKRLDTIGRIIDFCYSDINSNTSALTCASFPVMTFTRECDGQLSVKKWPHRLNILCTDMNSFSQRIALGYQEGFRCFDIESSGQLDLLHKEPNFTKQYGMNESICFSNAGYFLFVGSKTHGICGFDSRCANYHHNQMEISHFKGQMVPQMRVLANNRSLLVSDSCYRLHKIDLRMNKTILNYQEPLNIATDHKQEKDSFARNRERFSVDQDLNLICKVGGDMKLRIWNLSSGQLLFEKHLISLEPFSDTQLRDRPPVFSLIISKQRKFFVSIFDLRTTYCIYPIVDV